MVIAIWIVALCLLGLWSLAAWGLGSLISSDGRWVADLAPWLAHVPFSDVLENWFPTWRQSTVEALGVLQSMVHWLGNAAPVLVWTLWGAGTLLLLILAGVLHLVVALIRRHHPPQEPPAPGAPGAASSQA